MYRYFIVMVLIVMSTFVSFAQEDTETAPPVVSDALLEHLLDLERQTSELRGLEAEHEVDRQFPNREQLIDYVYNVIGAELTPEIVHETNVAYRAMGFWGADFDLEATYLALLSDQIAGFYDLETKIMNTVTSDGGALGNTLSTLDRIVYVHEYTHFLQDQNYDLTTLQESVDDDNNDGSMAVLSLIEGDASVVMADFSTKLLSENPLLAVGLLLTSLDTAMPEGVPDILVNELTNSYTAGEVFVRALVNEGGWEMVNDAYLNPPTSMMHIYYPHKYIEAIQPIEVTLTLDADVLGEGWAYATEAQTGIFYWREYARQTLGLSGVNPLIAGWMGDYNYFYYNESQDQVAWSSRITWEDQASRDTFYQAVGEVLDVDAESDLICGEVGEFVACIQPLDERDILYAVAPSIEQASALIELEG